METKEEVVEKDPVLEELLELVDLATLPKEDAPTEPEEEGTIEDLIKSAEPEPTLEVDEEVPEVPPVEPTELEQANATIAKLTEALNKPMEAVPIPEIIPTVQEPAPVIQQAPQPVQAPVPPPPPPAPVQQNVVPPVPQLAQESFDQIMTNPEAFQAHVQTVATQAAQQAREQTLLEIDSLVNTKMNARANVENQVKGFFSEDYNLDIVSKNHKGMVLRQAELVEQQNPTVPINRILQHSSNVVRQQVGLPIVDYAVPSVLVAPQQPAQTRVPSPAQRYAAPTVRRQAPAPQEDPNSITNQIIGMDPNLNGINNLLI